MSTSFSFPDPPTLNQIVPLPDGGAAQWNGYAWVSVEDNVTYPLEIPKGGTGATNPDTALSNLGGGVPIGIPIFKTTTAAAARAILGIGQATGEFIIPVDGTAAKPGLAFANEVALGWFRPGLSIVSMAAGGARVFDFNFANAADTTFGSFPRAAGNSTFVLNNQPFGTANANALQIAISATAMAITGTKSGSAGPIGLFINNGASVYFRTASIDVAGVGATGNAILNLNKGVSGQTNVIYGSLNGVQRWNLQLGAGGAETGSNAGSDFVIDRLSDTGAYLGSPFQIIRSTGNVNISNALGVGNGASINSYLTLNSGNLTVSAGDLSVSGNGYFGPAIVAGNFQFPGGMPVWNQDASNVYFQFAPEWRFQYTKSNGDIQWYRGTNPATVFFANGDFRGGRDVFAGTDGNFGLINSAAGYKYIKFDGQWRLQFTQANGDFDFVTYQNVINFHIGGGGDVSIPNSSLWVGTQVWSNAGASSFLTVDARGGFASRLMATSQTSVNKWNFFWNTDNHLYCAIDATNQGWVQLQASDERIKKNIKTLESDTATFMALRPISFQWNAPLRDTTKVQAGFSAQNAAKVMPQASVGDINSPRDDDGNVGMPASVDTTVILAHTVRQLQKLINRVTALEC